MPVKSVFLKISKMSFQTEKDEPKPTGAQNTSKLPLKSLNKQ